MIGLSRGGGREGVPERRMEGVQKSIGGEREGRTEGVQEEGVRVDGGRREGEREYEREAGSTRARERGGREVDSSVSFVSWGADCFLRPGAGIT